MSGHYLSGVFFPLGCDKSALSASVHNVHCWVGVLGMPVKVFYFPDSLVTPTPNTQWALYISPIRNRQQHHEVSCLHDNRGHEIRTTHCHSISKRTFQECDTTPWLVKVRRQFDTSNLHNSGYGPNTTSNNPNKHDIQHHDRDNKRQTRHKTTRQQPTTQQQ